ncbi:hypothetical protein DF153_31945 [Burkholderia cenocepacia]|nr:hypothetical protein DF152_32925 [Burkholderia cenocepacia]RQU13463.1 hypothetical protein DF153_31945 [Burkholderia cenocepacia]
MARDSRHCRESRRSVQVRGGMSRGSGRTRAGAARDRMSVPVGRPVQFSQNRPRPYLSVCRRSPKYWCHRTDATRRLRCANCDFT